MAEIDNSMHQPYSVNTNAKDLVDNPDSVDNNTSYPVQANYNYENVRLTTYDTWTVPFINKTILAKVGFYYLQEDDKVKCNFCRIIIKRWENGDNPIEEHIKWSPSCPLMRRRDTENIPIDADELNAILPPRSSDVCGHNPQENANEQIKYPEYRYEINRVHSFKEWPQALSPTRDDFNDTGLFYTGNGDKVICFSCGLGLKDWETGDIPLTEHARWTSGCLYLDHIKGERFVKDVQKSFEEPEISEIKIEEPQEATLVTNTCVICLENKKEFVFVPCGHLAACGKCSFTLNTCPICRTPIDKKQRVFEV